MTNTLEPRVVRIRDIWTWMKETADLFQRRVVFFVLLSLLFHYLAYSARSLGIFGPLLGLLICQLSIAISIAAAKAADDSHTLELKTVWDTTRNIIWYLMLLTLLYAVLFLIAAIVGQYIDFDLPSVDYSAKPLYKKLAWLRLGQFAFMIMYSAIVIASFWFLNPLLALHSMRLRDAISLAKRGINKNAIVIFVASYPFLLLILVLDLISELSLFANLFFVPLFGVYQYVSYRHVYLGKKENSPARVRASVAAVTSEPAR